MEKKPVFGMNAFKEWNIKVPLIQGGMGVGVSLSGLAGAVAAEGGIGIISTARLASMSRILRTMRKNAI